MCVYNTLTKKKQWFLGKNKLEYAFFFFFCDSEIVLSTSDAIRFEAPTVFGLLLFSLGRIRKDYVDIYNIRPFHQIKLCSLAVTKLMMWIF